MLVSFRSIRYPVCRRAISIACVLVAFLYLKVVNLDGYTLPIENAAIVPEVETNKVRPYPARLSLPLTEISFFLLPKQADCVRLRPIENFKASAFNSLQRRNYRVALPRSSVPDHL
jgi:hypothetical protein